MTTTTYDADDDDDDVIVHDEVFQTHGKSFALWNEHRLNFKYFLKKIFA